MDTKKNKKICNRIVDKEEREKCRDMNANSIYGIDPTIKEGAGVGVHRTTTKRRAVKEKNKD